MGFCVFPKKSCLADPVLGVWKVQNAFGIKGVTVSLKVLPAADTSADTCGDPTATIEYIGTKLHYKVSVKQTIPGQLHVRFFNKDGQSPAFTPYYHEGYYLGSSDVLLEDLNFKNGRNRQIRRVSCCTAGRIDPSVRAGSAMSPSFAWEFAWSSGRMCVASSSDGPAAPQRGQALYSAFAVYRESGNSSRGQTRREEQRR